MPATRLRNQQWLRSFEQVRDRGGSLEIAVARNGASGRTEQPHADIDFLWRVRLLSVGSDSLVVEHPAALGRAIDLTPGIDLVGILSIGQNRWMFRTRHAGSTSDGSGRTCLRLTMPDSLERFQRRHHYRMETAYLALPQVDIWPLLDPKSVFVAERANELAFEAMERTGAAAARSAETEALSLPDVGPKFRGRLLNLGGGGVGLHVESSDAGGLQHHRVFWLRITLPPELFAPICATAKLVHTHMVASQDYYAGMAFDFTFNPAHQRFVVTQINRYVAVQQREQLKRRSA